MGGWPWVAAKIPKPTADDPHLPYTPLPGAFLKAFRRLVLQRGGSGFRVGDLGVDVAAEAGSGAAHHS